MDAQTAIQLIDSLKAWMKSLKSNKCESNRNTLAAIRSMNSTALNLIMNIHISSLSGLRLIPMDDIIKAGLIDTVGTFQIINHFEEIGLPETDVGIARSTFIAINYNGLIYLSRYHSKINELIEAYYKFLEFAP